MKACNASDQSFALFESQCNWEGHAVGPPESQWTHSEFHLHSEATGLS